MNADPQETKLGSRYGFCLLAVFALAVLARSLDFERVLLPNGEVVFAAGDAFYHARRALFSFLQFPDLLLFDPCINYPDGARIPHPPLLDWVTAGIARGLGDSVSTFERVAAWTPVLLTSASVVPIAALGARVASRNVGLLAALVYGLLPICINYGQLGNFDHHAPAGLIGACLVLFYVKALDLAAAGRPLARVMAALVLLRVLMMLTWTGSLLYLLPGDIALVLVAAWTRNRSLLGAVAASAGPTALLVLPIIAALSEGAASAFVGVELSFFHPLIYGACALLCVAHGGLLGRRSETSAQTSVMLLIALVLPIAGASLMVPGALAGLQAALGFLGASDGYTETVVEQLPVFWGQGDFSLAIAHLRMGWFVYLIPIVPIAFLRLLEPGRRGFAGQFLVAWTVLFGTLAVQQVRYVHDFAPAGCVGFALLVFAAAEALAERAGRSAARELLAGVLALGLLLPSVPGFYAPVLGLAWHGFRGELDGTDRALLSVAGSQLRFAQMVGRSSAASGRCKADERRAPAYGVLAEVGLGHALHYAGGRATPADPFGPYIGQENFAAVQDFMEAQNEVRAVQIMQVLKTRYVATAASAVPRPARSMAHRLHEGDGSFVEGVGQLGRFRLVTEGPSRGLAMSDLFGDARESFSPYKLFELVPGATIELQTEPQVQMTAELPLKTPSGRRFVYRAAGKADRTGMVKIRVPYANPRGRPRSKLKDPIDRLEVLGPYAVRVGERNFRVHISEAEIQRAAVVRAREFEVFGRAPHQRRGKQN
jgi:dolichyl-diphosphooligosaccharide--protein glycosyltransferase